jgi:cell division protein FtsQ
VQSPLLAVDDVSVRGTTHETVDAVRAAAGVSQGDALLFVDTGAVARRIERLPWIAAAKVSREFPNGVTITVTERAPVAWMRRPPAFGAPADSGPAALVDASGRVLGDLPGPPPGLPELTGSLGLAATGHQLAHPALAGAVAQLPEPLRAQVASLGEERGGAVLKLALPAGARSLVAKEVRLGSLDEIRAKGAAALAVLDQLAITRQHVTYIDVRVPGAPATR